MKNPSPLEQLTAFALCFAFGVVSTVALSFYGNAVKAKATNPNGAK
jgi:hypothetical protein